MKEKSVYQGTSLNNTIMVLALGSLMIIFSIYLTSHYFDLRFPTGLENMSVCNFSQFFNCDKTAYSPMSNIAGVPISIFGIIIGALTMIGFIFKSENYEKTIYFTLAINFVGCVFLFLYSLFILKGLCPFCTFYYIVSGLALYLFFKKSGDIKPSIKYLSIFVVITASICGVVKINVDSKINAQRDVAASLLKQYFSLPVLGSPSVSSPFKLATVENAPIKVVIFSDFECPACKALAQVLHPTIAKFEGKIDIQYFFYPLDNSCNPSMERPLHHYACKAAYAASCMPEKDFAKIHNDLFFNQDKFEDGFLDYFIKTNGIEKCVSDPKTKEKVVALIKAADPFNIRSTPTFLINGVKIEGVLPSDQMSSIFEEIIRRSRK